MIRYADDFKNLRVLLIQMRKDSFMIEPERKNFLEHSGMSSYQLITLDLYRQPDFDPEMILDYDAFFVGGLSDDSSYSAVIDNQLFSFLDPFYDLLTLAIQRKIPGLLSCGGFMLACKYLGSEIILDPDQKELGCYDISLTKEGQKDILTKYLPPSFKMISGHNKSCVEVPPNCYLLGSSRRCRIHIIKRMDAPLYAFQGHPEITCPGLKARVETYKDKYFDDQETYVRVLSLREDTGLANSIPKKFLQLVSQKKLF